MPLLLFGSDPKIFYNFSRGALPSGTTFTRASAGTYFDADGVLQSATNNVPRFDHDPVTHAPRGLLYEGQAQNSTPQSAFASDWVAEAGAYLSINNAIAPNGLQQAIKIQGNGGGTSPQIRRGLSYLSGVTYTVSCFLKAGTANYAWIDTYDGVLDYGVKYNLATGTVVGTRNDRPPGVYSAYGIEPAGNGWYRAWFTFKSTGTGDVSYGAQVGVSGTDTLAFSTLETGNCYAFGYQHEVGAMSSYIATAATAVTRATDQVSFVIPSSVTKLRYVFDDNSTQKVSVSAGAYTVPTTLNRTHIKSIYGV